MACVFCKSYLDSHGQTLFKGRVATEEDIKTACNQAARRFQKLMYPPAMMGNTLPRKPEKLTGYVYRYEMVDGKEGKEGQMRCVERIGYVNGKRANPQEVELALKAIEFFLPIHYDE